MTGRLFRKQSESLSEGEQDYKFYVKICFDIANHKHGEGAKICRYVCKIGRGQNLMGGG